MVLSTPQRHYIGWGLLFLLIAAGGYLRLAAWWTAPIEGDQSILISIAMRFINRGWEAFPLAANKSSAGLMNPPLIEYVYILPLLISTSLQALHWFQAGLSLAAVVLLYGYGASLFGRRVGLIAALLFVVAPWAVFYGRFIWNPNPIPLFSTLLLMGLLAPLAAGRSPFHLVGALVGLTAVTQLHLSGLVLVPVVGLLLLLFWPQWLSPSWPRGTTAVLLGLLLSGLLYYPYLLFQRAVAFQDLRLVQETLLGGGEQEAQLNLASFWLHRDLATGQGYSQAMGLVDSVGPLLTWVPHLMQLLMGLTLSYLLLRPLHAMWQQRCYPYQLSPRNRTCLILLLWTAVPILLYLRHTVYLQNYYFLYFYPVPFLALALFADDIWRWLRPRWGQAAYLTFLPLILLGMGQFYLSHLRVQALQAGHNLPQRTAAQIDSAIQAGQQVVATYPDCDLILVAEGDSPETSSVALLEDFLHPATVRFVDRGRGYIYPAACSVYLNAAADGLVQDWLNRTAVLLPYTTQLGPTTAPFYYIPGHAQPIMAEPLARWQNGLALLHAHWHGELAPGAQLTLTYEWGVEGEENGRIQYHFFNHLINEAGELVAQEDSPAINALYWRTQDRLVTRFHLNLPPDLPAGQYTLLVGLYSWPDLQRIPLSTGHDVYDVFTLP